MRSHTFALLVSLALAAALAASGLAPAATPPRARPASATDTADALRRNDPAYPDAMALADLLQQAGIRIAFVGASKFVGLMDRPLGAAFVTDRGRFDVLFFPEPDGAERVEVEVEPKGRLFRHTFRWDDGTKEHVSRLTTPARQLFLRHGPWFVLAWSDSTIAILEETLALPRRGVG